MLQFERFSALAMKRDTPVDFSRAEVHVPVFNNSAGRDVSWLQYRAVAIVCHFGDDPDCGHCQCLFLSSGSSWLTDDGKTATRCPVVDPIRRSACLFWLIPQMMCICGGGDPSRTRSSTCPTCWLRPFPNEPFVPFRIRKLRDCG